MVVLSHRMEWNVLVLNIYLLQLNGSYEIIWIHHNNHNMYCTQMESAMYQIIQYAFPVYCVYVNNSSRASQLFSKKLLSVGPFYTMYGKHSLDNMLMANNEH